MEERRSFSSLLFALAEYGSGGENHRDIRGYLLE